jgi:hypothetical protein
MTRTTNPRRAAMAAFAIVFGLLIANGRAIGSGDTNATERTAAAIVERGSFLLADASEGDLFSRAVEGGRISIYPPLTALLASPVFAVFSVPFDFTPTGIQVAGKISAALLSALGMAVLASAFARRHSFGRSVASAVVIGIGTSVFSTSQALWQHPATVLFLSLACAALDRLSTLEGAAQRKPAMIAALGLALAAAARPAAIPMAAVLFVYLLIRTRTNAVFAIVAAALPAAGVAAYNNAWFGSPFDFGASTSGRFFAAFPESLGGLLISPARGLFVFTPLALVALAALVAAARRHSLGRALLAAAVIHLLFTSAWNEWHGGESFGPRLLTDMIPVLFFYLPEGFISMPYLGGSLAAISIVVQAIGAWTYDYRWERLQQRGRNFDAALWSWRDSPVAFAIREGVVIQGTPDVDVRRIRLQSRRYVPFGPRGSVIEMARGEIKISDSQLLRDINLVRGARVADDAIVLAHPADALTFRAAAGGQLRLVLSGTLVGVLVIDGPDGAQSQSASGPFETPVALRVEEGDSVSVRASSGELRIRGIRTTIAGATP